MLIQRIRCSICICPFLRRTNMKKFIFNCLITLSVLFILLFFYNIAFLKLNPSYEQDTVKFNNVPMNIEIANAGNSHGLYAFRYDETNTSCTCFNFAMTSQSLSYDYRIIQQYEQNIKNAKILFIPISYSSFSYNETSEVDFMSKNERYYRFLKPQYIKSFSLEQYILLKTFPVLYASPSDLATALSPVNTDISMSTNIIHDFSSNAFEAYTRHYTAHLNNNGQLNNNPDEIIALYNIIRLCQKENIRPILITTPFRHEYNELFNNEFYNNFYSTINKVIVDTGCEYYDYSHDSTFTNNDNYFSDADHLSEKGGEYFTQKILNAYTN